MTIEIAVQHEGKKYVGEIGRIDGTHLGYEDHGIFSVNVNFDFGGSHQGTGHYGASKGFGEAFIQAFLKIAGVGTWEKVKGQRVIVLYEERRGMVRGIASLDGNRVVIFSELLDRQQQVC